MTAAELAALPDALWEKYSHTVVCIPLTTMEKDSFFSAIKEAMQAQKKRDAEICRELERDGIPVNELGRPHYKLAAPRDCAAAIEREPI